MTVTGNVEPMQDDRERGARIPVRDDPCGELTTEITKGLSAGEARTRIGKYGYNEIPEEKPRPFLALAGKFWGPTAWILEAVIILSLFLKNYADTAIILGLLVFNAVLGSLEEGKASRSVDALKQKLQVQSRTLRDRSWQILPSRELVCGDIVRIRAGDFVPADLNLLEGQLEVDQSALTGESLPLHKKTAEKIYSGSVVQSGEATAVVVATGTKTSFGKTAELVRFARPKLHSEEVIARIVKWLLAIVGIALVTAFVVAILAGIPWFTIVPLALVLLASSIPVALPAMFTITLALGSLELVRQGVLVTRLNAAEDAAMMDTLCSDKTGTITQNRLSVAGIIPLNGAKDADVLRYGALASEEANRDPIDLAFLSGAADRAVSLEGFTRRSFVPFNPGTRRTEAIVERDGAPLLVVKGAVAVICDLTGSDTALLEQKAETFAAKGYRILAVAAGPDKNSLKPVGLVGLYDLPRPDAARLLEDLRSLGISVKMLTGDAADVAKETARQVGLSGTITTSQEFRQAQDAGPEQASLLAEESAGFAEIYPEDKYAIVKSLQNRGHIVGMTGDGINDAPSLKQAEVGIAVNTATDVAKGAASAVLTGEGLCNIVDLVRVGRMMHQRMLTWIFNKIVKTFQIVVFVVVAFLLTGTFIVSVFDVVLLLFVVDFVTLSISTDNVRGSPLPDSWNLSDLVRSSLLMGILVVLESLAILFIGCGPLDLAGDTGAIQSYSFAILFYFGLLMVFVVRERGHFWDSLPARPLLLITLADMAVVALLLTFGIPGLKPIPVADTLALIAMAGFFCFAVNDTVKYFLLRPRNKEAPQNR